MPFRLSARGIQNTEPKTNMTDKKPASCPYGTYQRATSGHHLASITPLKLVRLMHSRLNAKAKRSLALREARHSLIRGAFAHLENDLEVWRMCR